MKRHDKLFNKNEKHSAIAEVVIGELFKAAESRRLIVRKPSGNVLFEIPMAFSIALLVVLLIFFSPFLIVSLVVGYQKKLRLEMIRDVTDEEANELDNVDYQQTMMGDTHDQETIILS